MAFSSLFGLHTRDLTSEAEVETRLLAKLFTDLGYPDLSIIPKKAVPSLNISSGSKTHPYQVDFLLKSPRGAVKVLVEAKEPDESVPGAWGQAASYALSYNRDKKPAERIDWLLISNGHTTSLFKHDSATPTITLDLSDFASGAPPYVSLRTLVKFLAFEKQATPHPVRDVLFAIEANERVSRIARINMYLHGDGGSYIFHGDGLDNDPVVTTDMSQERKDEVTDHKG